MSDIELRILKILKGHKRGLGAKELAKKVGAGKKDREAFRDALTSLCTLSELVVNNGKYVAPASLGLEAAEIVKVTGSFGFARLSSGKGADVFISGRLLMGSMPGDSVLIRRTRGHNGLPEGEVRAIVKASDNPFAGVVSVEMDGCFVIPDKYVRFPIRLEGKSSSGLQSGDKILAVLIKRGERHARHIARAIEVFGDSSSAQACCRAILAGNGINTAFPDEVLESARHISGSGIHPKEIAARKDLRDETIFTIDGADTKDIDDAISLKRLAAGWELGVHIADVSYYVQHKSPLDEEALTRGTSVYYADSVVPMLPKELSNGICSLNPGEDRLAFSAVISLDENAAMTSYSFEKTVIRSRVKGVYSEVNALFDGCASRETAAKYACLGTTLADMRELADILAKKRRSRGGMELETVESQIIVAPDGRAADIKIRERGIGERMIEEFMLAANEAAASLALSSKLPFVYRIHENPPADKIASLYETLDSLGIRHSSGTAVTPAGIADIVDSVSDAGLGVVVNTLVLRSMSKAKYAPENTGHFGLALGNYTHFTSPIRRYPDLFIHRVLSAHITGMRKANIEKRFRALSAEASIRSTEREMAAVTAERDCESCYKAEYMERFIGESFDGVIASVTPFGAYIRLENTVEGLVRLPDFPAGEWAPDGIIAFTDKLSGRKFRLGDSVRVKIAGVNISAGQVDMLFA